MIQDDAPGLLLPENGEDSGGFSDSQDGSLEILNAKEEDSGVRLDVYLASRLGITRSFARRLIDDGNVSLFPEKKAKPALRMGEGSTVRVVLPPPESLDLEPEEVAFGVVYEDEHIIVVDKPSGVVVHPAPGNWHGTLVHGLLYRFRDFGAFNNVLRPGIVHRLDATTSGLMVVAREQKSLESLQEQFRQRTVLKKYLALVHGKIKQPSGRIDLPIGRSSANRLKMAVAVDGRHAVTKYRVLWRRKGYSFLECTIETGRTHQIRVHLGFLGHPIVGDSLYGGDKKTAAILGRVFLHSWKLSFLHPATGTRMSFTSILPDALTGQLQDVLSTVLD
ncbi:RluA family pseudouridine synthase [Aminivibrio sp.]|jgi:23S rRNA pseudouridine1911/1915/1917 synthase|uniref:RluA family pseudouridine synthase n=1 Tax=Aminivibrio sp. TaxID=1872489 RepID=UPI0016B8ABEC|nr:RluA family pseudouridine synthase [Synergistaceae bacterium]MDD4611469.1 RluA family pseudouridine synthase [Synergistaceae bacterium]NLO57579.1 RluA family pseudouridine synthase [Synergistaceae bacterium]